MKIRDCMSSDVRLTKPGETIQAAATIMAEIDVGAIPVAESEKLVGMITDRDIAIRAVAVGKAPDSKIRDIMSHDVKYCYEDEEAERVLHNMGENQLRRLPVLNREKRLVGIVSIGDLAVKAASDKTGEALGDISRPGGTHSQTAGT